MPEIKVTPLGEYSFADKWQIFQLLSQRLLFDSGIRVEAVRAHGPTSFHD